MTTLLNVIQNALFEINAYSPGETISAEDANLCLSKANRLFDSWNASKIFVYAVNFAQYNMIAGHNPLTIGQGVNITSVSAAGLVATYTAVNNYQVGQFISTTGNGVIGGVNFDQTNVIVTAANGTSFTLACGAGTVSTTTVTGTAIVANSPSTAFPDIAISSTRPIKIVNANIILNQGTGATTVRTPVAIEDAYWWANQRVPLIQTDLPKHLYYQPSYPNGQMFLWPIPNVTYPLEIETWTNLSGLGLTDTFTLPPGYEDAVTYTLAETLCPSFSKTIDQTLVALARNARALIQGNNSAALRITTADLGLPKGERTRPYFNYLVPADLTGGR